MNQEKFLKVCKAVALAIRDLKEIPSGVLYSQVMDKIDLETYQDILVVLEGAKLIKVENHYIKFTGNPV